jgi:hypothetical protein
VRPPVGPIPNLVFNDLPLVFSVHPRQHELLRALAQHYGSGSGWEDLQQRVWAQRSLREHLFEWISDLDQTYHDAPDDFEFPDPYSLLLLGMLSLQNNNPSVSWPNRFTWKTGSEVPCLPLIWTRTRLMRQLFGLLVRQAMFERCSPLS